MDGKGEAMSEDDEAEKVTKNTPAPRAPRADSDEEVDELDESMDEKSEVEEDSEDEDEEVEELSGVISASEDEDEEESPHIDSLQTFITSLDAGQKRKASDDEDESSRPSAETRPQKRRLLHEQTEAGIENEFAAHTGTFSATTYRFCILTLCLYLFRRNET